MANPPRKRADPKRWPADFIDALKVSKSVTQAAQRAGVTTAAVYTRRKRDPSFRAKWEAAVEERVAVATIAHKANSATQDKRKLAPTKKGKGAPAPPNPLLRARQVVEEVRAYLAEHHPALMALEERGGRPDSKVWPFVFLAVFAEVGVKKYAAEAAGVSRQAVDKRLKNDDEFAALYAQAERDAFDALLVTAKIKASEMGGALMIYLLKCLGGPQFNPSTDLRHAGHQGGPVQVEGRVEHTGELEITWASAQEIAGALVDAGVIGEGGVIEMEGEGDA